MKMYKNNIVKIEKKHKNRILAQWLDPKIKQKIKPRK